MSGGLGLIYSDGFSNDGCLILTLTLSSLEAGSGVAAPVVGRSVQGQAVVTEVGLRGWSLSREVEAGAFSDTEAPGATLD